MLQSDSPSVPATPRPTTKLNSTLDGHLTAYMAAATAAGVSLLATAANAEIVFTPANVEISSSYALDLNHDGVTDFTFQWFTIGESDGIIGLFYLNLNVPGNAARPAHQLTNEAAPLPQGAKIGPLKSFTSRKGSYGDVGMYEEQVFSHSGITTSESNGAWVKQTNKFVGLRFIIGSEFHYGWARLSSSPSTGPVLTGYAYETNPGVRIEAGQIGGGESDAKFIPPITLGELAKGAGRPRFKLSPAK